MGPFYCHASAAAGLISKRPRVSGDLQHQTSVTQTSLWFLYMYFMFVFFFLFFKFIFLERRHTDKVRQCVREPPPLKKKHAHTHSHSWNCQFTGCSVVGSHASVVFMTLKTDSAFTTSSGSKVSAQVKHTAVPRAIHQTITATPWEILTGDRFWKITSTCHAITTSPKS